MKRIGLDARMIFYTGIGRHVQSLIERVPALDPGSEYCLFVRPEDSSRLPTLAPNCRVIPTIDSIYDLAEQTRHLQILTRAGLDLLHVPHFNIPILYRGKLVVTIHDLIQARFPSQPTLKAQIKRLGYKFVISRAIDQADEVIAVSRYTRDDIIRTFGPRETKLKIIYNGVDTPRDLTSATSDLKNQIRGRYGLKSPFFLYVGLSSPHKNLLRLIEAMAQVKDEYPKAQLAIVGKKDPRYLPDLEKTIQAQGLQSSVILTDYVPDSELAVLYQEACAFVFPSLYEGFGIPPLEALTYGLPVASSNAASLPEVLGENATYFDPHKVDDIARVLKKLLAENSVPKCPVPINFSWDTMARETLAVYQAVLSAPAK